MPLTLRPTGLSSPAYRDWLDYVIVEDGRDVGRLYEDRHSPPEYRWFWSITIYVNPMLGIVTSGRAPSLDEAKAQFLTNWQKCRTELDSARALFYLSRPCQVCVRVPCRWGSSRRASLRAPHSRPPVRFGCTKSNGTASGSSPEKKASGFGSIADQAISAVWYGSGSFSVVRPGGAGLLWAVSGGRLVELHLCSGLPIAAEVRGP